MKKTAVADLAPGDIIHGTAARNYHVEPTAKRGRIVSVVIPTGDRYVIQCISLEPTGEWTPIAWGPFPKTRLLWVE